MFYLAQLAMANKLTCLAIRHKQGYIRPLCTCG